MTTVSVWRRGGEVEEVGGTWHNFRKLQFCDGLEHWWPAASGSALPSLDKDTLLSSSPALAWPGSLAGGISGYRSTLLLFVSGDLQT